MWLRWLNPFVWWRRMQRQVDRQFLIPALEARCKDDFQLAHVFALHMAYDRAWQVADWEYTEWEMAFLERLNAA